VERTLTQAGDASPEEVWRRYADLGEWSRWAPFIQAVDSAGRELVPGLTGTVIAVGGLRVGFEVLAVDATARTWRWCARLGTVSLVLDHEVAVRPAGGAIAVLAISGAAPVVLSYLLPAQLALRSLVRV
jgi:Polyketide cyclase / dehydrase and lipid transport